ncbi:MAG: YbaN family protein [Paracoccaceae bacterium]|nr:YbaN family protein [Paracoccaceae bacterium]
MQWLWAAFGILALAFGIVGIVLPLLPTVPFLLLAAFCFARSSERLHDWLLKHPLLGPPIERWNRSGAIARRAKVFASGSMLLVFSISLLLGLRPLILIVQGVALSCAALFIWTRPEA